MTTGIDRDAPRATLAEIHSANELAMQVWRQDQAPAQAYLSSRGFDLRTITELGYDIGHAGSDGPVRGALEAHGFPARVAAAAGLIRSTDSGGVIDSFRHRLMFAIRTIHDGSIAGFVGRAMPQAHPDAPRWLNTRTTASFRKGELLYGLWEARRIIEHRHRPVTALVVCEGPLDAIAVTVTCPVVAVAPAGTALTQIQARWIADLAAAARVPIVVAGDGDEPGQRAGAKAAQMIAACSSTATVRAATLPAGEDPASLAVKSPDVLCQQITESVTPPAAASAPRGTTPQR